MRWLMILLLWLLPAVAGAAEVVIMETSRGKIRLELNEKLAPETVRNFLQYAEAGFYDATIFHRVIDGFMIQGGGFTPDLQQKPTRAPIRNEAANGLKNLRGTIAMARTPVVDSATSQFFINLVDNRALDHRGPAPGAFGYAVFGRVVEGMDVVDAIGKMKTTNKSALFQNLPEETVIIRRIRRAAPRGAAEERDRL